MSRLMLRNESPPWMNAETYSAAVGRRPGTRRGSAKLSAAVGAAAGASATLAALAILSVIGWSSCSVGLPSVAATSVIVAPLNAGAVTSDNSTQSAREITIVPESSKLYSTGLTPTLTASTASSLISSSMSLPSLVALIRAVNIMPFSVSRRLVTMPTGAMSSWYLSSLGLRPLTGSDPRSNLTR